MRRLSVLQSWMFLLSISFQEPNLRDKPTNLDKMRIICALEYFNESEDESNVKAAEIEVSMLRKGDLSLKPHAKKCTQKEYCCVASNQIQKPSACFGLIHHQLIVEFIFTPPPWKPPDRGISPLFEPRLILLDKDSNKIIRDMRSFGNIDQAIGARRQASSLLEMRIFFR